MGFLRGYLKPREKAVELQQQNETQDSPPSVGGSSSTGLKALTPMYPMGDFRNADMDEVSEIKSDVMVNYLHQQQLRKMWSHGGLEEGVLLKKSRNDYMCCPQDLSQVRGGIFDCVVKMNVRCALTVNTRIIKLFLRRQDMNHIPLDNGLRIQILPSIQHLPRCQKHHFAAFIQDSAILVVWDDDPNLILGRAQTIENQLMSMIWTGEMEEGFDEKSTANNSKMASKAPSVHVKELDGSDVEEVLEEAPRRAVLIQPFLVGCTLLLTVAALGSGWRKVLVEILYDGSYMRCAFAIVVPIQLWLSLFFFQSLCGCLAQIFGPISQMTRNSKYYSGLSPPRIQRKELPHVTIQCPVYKEGLWSVIDPTVKSIKCAISTYEMQGGTANIFINDDGMQIIPPEEAQERRDYYDEHNIGWVSRPKHKPKPAEGETAFIRPGKFKKASNMNYALAVSARVEDKLANINRPETWTVDDESEAYATALGEIIEEDEGRTWADGNVRMGDYILLIDSDTRVPVDCFLDAVSEMELSPQVAIIQHSSGVMNVTQSFFERGITFFTNLIYSAIEFAVSNGDVAPFVGHNAFLRWTAIQDIAYVQDGIEKYWSEATVSEDFDMALRLQTSGYVLRLAAYSNGGFKEGVSLTVYDELARWEKYAYGCSELVFHPLRYWIFRGPFTPLFRSFMASKMPLPSKITIMAYVGTYYALASAWLLTLLNYFIVGWFLPALDKYYYDSFNIFFSIIIVFNALGNAALAVLRYRYEDRNLFGALLENAKWIPLLTIFLGGVSLHVSQAILSHLFSIDMSWGATSKEASDTSFFEEIPKVLKKFRVTFAFCIIMITTMIVLGGVGPVGALIPWSWTIVEFTAIFPFTTLIAAHFLLPTVLNPGLMLFTW